MPKISRTDKKRSWIVYPVIALLTAGSFIGGYISGFHANQTKQSNEEKYPSENAYEKFLKQKGALEFEIELGDVFSKEYASPYLDLLKSGKAIELIRKLGPEFSNYNVPYYARLLNNGINVDNIASLDSNYISEITRNIDEIPKDLLEYIGSPRKQSLQAANSDPLFGTDEDRLREYLRQKLREKAHASRKDADFNEGSSQLDDVSNINLLYLVKGYVDFFEDADNLRETTKFIFEDSDDPFSEHGGLVFCKDGKYKFVPINSNKNNRERNMENDGVYVEEPWMKFIGAIGNYHIHARKKDNSDNAGPSGSKQSLEEFLKKGPSINYHGRYPSENGDFSPLSDRSNPYRVECVITRLGGERFNVDVYFVDKDKDKAYVLDIGVYDMQKGN
jgi:hypothetical protein